MHVHVYVILLVLVLLHNLGENDVIPRERRLSASVFTWFELASYFVHLVTVCQLLLLIFSLSAFPFENHEFEIVFNIFLAQMPNQGIASVLWPLAVGATALLGAIPVILREVRVFEASDLFYGVFEIPIIFNVVKSCFHEHPRIMILMALFLLAESTVWMYFRRITRGEMCWMQVNATRNSISCSSLLSGTFPSPSRIYQGCFSQLRLVSS